MKKIYLAIGCALMGFSFSHAQTTVYSYTGGMQTYVVPANVTGISFDISGAQGGGDASVSAPGGMGGRVQATMTVTPGQTLNIYVGGAGNLTGTPGYNGGGSGFGGAAGTPGGGGGGASDIRIGGTALTNRVIVGGGGGGGTSNCTANAGGAGGGLIGANGGGVPSCWGCSSATSATGGTQGAGGLGGTSSCAWNGSNGALGIGGNTYMVFRSAGGGGGYYGGGGAHNGCSGAGGSSYTDPSMTNVIHTQGYQAGNGIVTITVTTLTFVYTGAAQTYTLPSCGTATFEAKGAQGGAVTSYSPFPQGGLGADMKGNFSVNNGDVLTVVVGGRGLSDPSTSGGGGGSGVNLNGTAIIVAGGGAGVDFQDPNYAGQNAVITNSGIVGDNAGGAGGTGGGVGGDYTYNASNISRGGNGWNIGHSGSTGVSGTSANTTFTAGTWGLGGGGGAVGYGYCNCGAGGGGYSGGGAGSANKTGGGGGSFNSGTSQTNVAGVNTGNGVVIINFTPGPVVGPPVVITGSSPICPATSNTYSIASVVGATSYTWIVPAGTTITSGQGTTSITITAGTTSGNITVTANNACGAGPAITFALSINPLPTVGYTFSPTSAVCTGSTETLSGTGATSYAWTGGVTNTVAFTPVSTGNYTVTGTDANGCTNTAVATVTVNPLPTVTATSTAPAVCTGNSVTLTGGGATSYSWTGGVTNAVPFTPVNTLTYTVTGTDANSCTNTATTTVTVNPLPTVTVTPSSTSICTGSSVTITASGALTYFWTPTSTTGSSVTDSPTSNTLYNAIGTDGNGCSNNASVLITVNPLPTVTATSTAPAVCAGNSVTLTGGGAVSYTWTGGVTDGNSFIPLSTLTYTVTGMDANSCTNTATTTVTVNPLPTVTANSTSAAVCTGNSVTLTGGGAVSYTWTGGVTDGNSFIPLSTLTYTVTGMDANSCTNTATTTVTVNPLPTVTATSTAAAVCAGNSVTLTGGGAVSYTWTGGVTDGNSFIPLSTLTYTVTGMDANSCTNTATTTVTVNPLPTLTTSAADVNPCITITTDALTGTPNGGTWSGPGVTGTNFDPATAGTGAQVLTYSFTDANSCSNSMTLTVNVNVCAGVEATSLSNGVNVYPNPNSGSFTLAVNANVGDMTIEVVDMQGRVVFSSQESNVNAGFAKQISMDNLANGIYMMRLTTKDAQRIEKISVQK